VKRLLLLSVAAAATVFAAACSDSDNSTAPDLNRNGGPELNGPGQAANPHLFMARGNANGAGARHVSLLSWHGGPVMRSGADVTPIFWGSGWNNSSFAGTKVSDMGKFYGGMGGTAYDLTDHEYADGSGSVGSAVSVHNALMDTGTEPPSGAPQTAQILNEVCKMVGSSAPTNGTGYYPVYVTTKRGNAGYCAWHSAGTCGGKTVQFAFFFNLDGDAGCDPGDSQSGHSQGVAAIANVSGHELSEALTDPQLNAWYDQQGNENSDKCAWTFSNKLVQFSNGTSWKIQGNWSNAAYNGNRGYVRGCIDGN